jgi:hypothetical protein
MKKSPQADPPGDVDDSDDETVNDGQSPSNQPKAEIDEDEKIRIRREKKRESVRRSRKRQRDYVVQIEEENQRLKDEMNLLRSRLELVEKLDPSQSMGFQSMPRHISMVPSAMCTNSLDTGAIAPNGKIMRHMLSIERVWNSGIVGVKEGSHV